MSGAQTPPGHRRSAGAGGDPSMEDILASIRRILSEDEAPPSPAAAPPAAKPDDRSPSEGVLVLDPSMMVAEPAPVLPSRATTPCGPSRRLRAQPVQPGRVAVRRQPGRAGGRRRRRVLGRHPGAHAGGRAVDAGAQRRPDDRRSRARGNPAAAEGMARRPPAAPGRAAGADRDRARRRPRRPLSRIAIAGLLRHPPEAAGERDAGQDLQPRRDRAPPV